MANYDGIGMPCSGDPCWCGAHDDNGDFDAELAAHLAIWPNCTTPDCENKQCEWAGMDVCHPCAVKRVGLVEMERRYAVTHPDGQWDGTIATEKA